MNMQLTIRDASKSERQVVLDLTLKAYAEFEKEAPPGFWPQYMSNISATLLNDESAERIIALVDGNIVGSVLVYESTPESPYPKIRLLAVDPDLRQSGIAGALMRECENRLVDRGHETITLHTTSLMKTARAMYERHGYLRHPAIDFEPVSNFTVWGFRKSMNQETRQSHEVTTQAEICQARLVTFSSSKGFDDVIASFENQLGRLDQIAAQQSDDMAAAIKGMEGPLGLMIISTLAMDKLLPALSVNARRSTQYLVGNPLIASEMAQHHILASLYAPPRVLIYSDKGATAIAYEQPSSTFGRLQSSDSAKTAAILKTAEALDHKFETLAKAALR